MPKRTNHATVPLRALVALEQGGDSAASSELDRRVLSMTTEQRIALDNLASEVARSMRAGETAA